MIVAITLKFRVLEEALVVESKVSLIRLTCVRISVQLLYNCATLDDDDCVCVYV